MLAQTSLRLLLKDVVSNLHWILQAPASLSAREILFDLFIQLFIPCPPVNVELYLILKMTFFCLVSGQASFGRHYKSLMRKPASRLSLTLDLAPPNEIPSGCCRLSQPFIQTLTSGNLI